jgi:hypothetical protein
VAREGVKAANPASGEAIRDKAIAEFAAQALKSCIFRLPRPM